MNQNPIELNNGNGKISVSAIMWILTALLLVTLLLSVCLGRYPIGAGEIFYMVMDRLGFGGFDGSFSHQQELAFWNVRMPRLIIAFLVGAALSVAGCTYQTIFQNPMASPDILGASSGAGLGAAVAIYFGFSSWSITAMAFMFSLAAVTLSYILSLYSKSDRILALVFSGIVIGSLCKAGVSYIKLVADPTNQLPSITYWLMGSIVGAKNSEAAFIIWPMLIGFTPLMLLRWRMNILSLGDAEAKTTGVNAERLRFVSLLAATLLTAAAVSVSGLIGWVGLVIPHMMRRVIGVNLKYLLPASFIFGGSFMVFVDNFSRSVAKTEIPLGIVTAFIGAPIFMYIITRRRSGQ